MGEARPVRATRPGLVGVLAKLPNTAPVDAFYAPEKASLARRSDSAADKSLFVHSHASLLLPVLS